jgi:ankyrin repeat protein
MIIARKISDLSANTWTALCTQFLGVGRKERAYLMQKNDKHQTVLMACARSAHFKFVRQLLDNNFPVDEADIHGSTVLHYLFHSPKTSNQQELSEIAALICKRNCMLCLRKNDKGMTPWQLAAERGFHCSLAIMASYHAISRLDAYGMTALGCAAQHGRGDTIHFLIESLHVDVNAISNDGITALHIAAQCSQSEAFVTLLHHGANPLICHPQLKTTVHSGLHFGNSHFLDVLQSQLCFAAVSMENTHLLPLVQNANADALLDTILSSCDPSALGATARDGKNLLMLSVGAGNDKSVQRLLLAGGNPLYRTETG